MFSRVFHPSGKDILVSVIFLAMCCLLVFAAVWAYRMFITTPPYVDPARYPVRGIDVSSHNGEPDFRRAAASGMEFAFIKATEGTDFVDSKFFRNYKAATEAGLKVGVYHFFRFNKDGVEQAINLMRTVGRRRPQLGLVIDVERSGNDTTISADTVKERLAAMADYLNLLGHRVTFYSNRDGYYDYIADRHQGAPLWICAFSETPINAEWTFWQFDHHGRLDGFDGDVDLNAFCGSREEWQAFLDGALWPYTPQDAKTDAL